MFSTALCQFGVSQPATLHGPNNRKFPANVYMYTACIAVFLKVLHVLKRRHTHTHTHTHAHATCAVTGTRSEEFTSSYTRAAPTSQAYTVHDVRSRSCVTRCRRTGNTFHQQLKTFNHDPNEKNCTIQPEMGRLPVGLSHIFLHDI